MIVITLITGRQKPGVMVAALHAADISVGCMGMVGPVKSAADRPRSPWRGPRAPRSAVASDGAARAGRRCGPPWAIGARGAHAAGLSAATSLPRARPGVAPRNARAVSVEHGFDETAIIAGGDTGVTGFPETQVLDTLH